MVVLIYMQHLSMFLWRPVVNLLRLSSPRNCHMSPELRLRMASWVEKSSRAWFGRCGLQHLSMNCGALMSRSGAAHGSLDAGCHTSQLITVP